MTEPLTLEGLKLGTLRVVDLKDALKERNLPTDGKKVRGGSCVFDMC